MWAQTHKSSDSLTRISSSRQPHSQVWWFLLPAQWAPLSTWSFILKEAILIKPIYMGSLWEQESDSRGFKASRQETFLEVVWYFFWHVCCSTQIQSMLKGWESRDCLLMEGGVKDEGSHFNPPFSYLSSQEYTCLLCAKYIKGLNVSAKTIKLIQENKEVNLHDLGCCNEFLNMTVKA